MGFDMVAFSGGKDIRGPQASGVLIGKEELIKKVEVKKYVTETTGELTIRDILNELRKPGLDPRTELEPFEFAAIYKIEDVKVGMIVPGIVTNITRFGAFIDIGVHQDGLVHISHLSDKFVKDPKEVITVQQKVMVTVVEVDVPRKRIGLSMKSDPFADQPQQQAAPAKRTTPGKAPFKGQERQKEKPKEKEATMEEKLAMLMNKFKK